MFSKLAGLDRQFMLVAGNGLTLRVRSAEDRVDFEHRVDRLLEPFAFRGDWDVDCALAESVEVLNVMTRRAVRPPGSRSAKSLHPRSCASRWRDAHRLRGGPAHRLRYPGRGQLARRLRADRRADMTGIATAAAGKGRAVLIRLDRK